MKIYTAYILGMLQNLLNLKSISYTLQYVCGKSLHISVVVFFQNKNNYSFTKHCILCGWLYGFDAQHCIYYVAYFPTAILF